MLQIVVFDEGIYADRSVGVYNISTDPYKSGSRGFFSPSPHTTRRAGPHRAVHIDYRAVAG